MSPPTAAARAERPDTRAGQDVRQQTRELMTHLFRVDDLRDDEDVFEAGYANSLFAMRLVQFVEQELGVAVTGADLVLDNFRSIERIVHFVEGKRGERPIPPGD